MKNTVHNWRPEGDWIFAGLGKPYLSYTRRKCTRCGNVQTRVGTVHAVWVDGMNPVNTHFKLQEHLRMQGLFHVSLERVHSCG